MLIKAITKGATMSNLASRFCVLLYICASCAAVAADLTLQQKKDLYVMEMQDRVRAQLKDPDSAEFRAGHFSEKGGAKVVCGEVNSKNSFGGFTGFQRFIAAGNLVFLEENMAAGEMDKSWSLLC